MSVRNGVPALSVVVLAYRNEDTVEAAVDSLLRQTSDEPFEVVLVASGGDGSAERIRRRHPAVVVVVATPERLLPGAARNAGAAVAAGRVVAFLAADCLAEPGWISARLASHRSGARAVASAVTNAAPHTRWSDGAYFAMYCSRLPGRRTEVVSWPDSAVHGLSFDRDLLRDIGPFAEHLPVSEDTDMARRLHDAGVAITYSPEIRTAHMGPSRALAVLRDQYRRGLARAPYEQPSWAHASIPSFASGALRGALHSSVHWRLTFAWRDAGEDRRRLRRAAPMMVVCVLVNRFGWLWALCRERVRDRTTTPPVKVGRSGGRAAGAARARSRPDRRSSTRTRPR